MGDLSTLPIGLMGSGDSKSSLSTQSVTGPFSYDTLLVVYEGVDADLSELTDLTDTVTEDGLHKVTGRLDNLGVTVTEAGVVWVGSLAVYRHGTNAVPLSLAGTREAVHDVARRLGIVVPGAGLVTRLDVGANVEVEEDPSQYARLIMGAGRLDARPLGPASVVVGRSPSQEAVYDKQAELRAKGRPVPEEWGGRHVVRYEARCLRRVRTAFAQPVYAEDLWDPRLYVSAVGRAVSRLDRIRFARKVGPVPTGSVRELDEHLYAAGVEASGGAAALLRLVAAMPKGSAAERTRASRVRTRIRERASAEAAGRDLGAELKAAVKTAASLSYRAVS